jgi:RNA polymerase sigma factor (sigma-70 family)
METRDLPATDAERPPVEDPEAPPTFEGLFDAEHRRLHRALCVLTGDPHEAEELAQDAFVRVWEHWHRVRVMDDPTGYLYRTAMNGYRSRYRRALLALRSQFTQREAADGLAVIDDRDAVVRRLDRLTRNQRAAVVLLDLLEFTSEEAASILRSTPGAVRTQASRGRAALRQTEGDLDA